MGRRGLCLAAVLLVASVVQAAWTPSFQPSYIQLRPGEATEVTVYAAWRSGVTLTPFYPWTFTRKDPTIATVVGNLQTAREPSTVRIDAHRIGVTYVRVVDPAAPVDHDYMH